MLSLYLGAAAFLLYFLYDINSFLWKHRVPRCFFLIGTLLLGISAVLDLYSAWKQHAFSGILDILLLSGGVLSFALLLYCLFFALPFKSTYTKQETGCCVYDQGVYALCRHPGVLCFFSMYLFLSAAALPGKMILNGIVFSLLNLVYVWFQDRVTFPKTFCDYQDYRKRVPFLIPTKVSFHMAWKTFFHSYSEEDNS